MNRYFSHSDAAIAELVYCDPTDDEAVREAARRHVARFCGLIAALHLPLEKRHGHTVSIDEPRVSDEGIRVANA
jgi:hypothetical protein